MATVFRACSTVGNALHSHCRDHRFESGQVHTKRINIYGPLAHLVERLYGIEKVRGSNPLRSTKENNRVSESTVSTSSGFA